MKKFNSSPTGRLLRNSRFFAVPEPLHFHETDIRPSRNSSYSETATTNLPTKLAITTPKSSLLRGDWGLKRSLPLRKTKHSRTPAIRVNEADTIEHVTDFDSAGDHTQTLAKLQELNMAFITVRNTVSDGGATGAFEPQVDNTDISTDVVDNITNKLLRRRWKYAGPALGSLTELEFRKYIRIRVKCQKESFHQYVKEQLLENERQAKIQEARDVGQDITVVDLPNIDEEMVMDYIKLMRRDKYAELCTMITNFLDLPPPASRKTAFDGSALFHSAKESLAQGGMALPIHPSGGISYNVSASYVENDPLHGPKNQHAAVPARVVQPRRFAGSNFHRAFVGVAGVTASAPLRSTGYGSNAMAFSDGTSKLDLQTYGSAKVWVVVKHARMDADGRILLELIAPDPSNLAVTQGKLVDKVSSQYRPAPSATDYAKGASHFGAADFKSGAKSRDGENAYKRGLDALRGADSPHKALFAALAANTLHQKDEEDP